MQIYTELSVDINAANVVELPAFLFLLSSMHEENTHVDVIIATAVINNFNLFIVNLKSNI